MKISLYFIQLSYIIKKDLPLIIILEKTIII